MTHGGLFSGIGGFDLAAEWMGWQNIFHCEINDFSQKVLKYYWPNSISYDDIKQTDFSVHRGTIDILTGGFPCQPYSQAGKRKGKEDDRHLWPEMLRAIREIQPRWVVGENVFGLINWSWGMVFNEVQTDLEAEGYEVWPYVLPACAVNAPHKRDRVWFVAHNNGKFWGTGRNVESREQSRHRKGILSITTKRLITNTNNTGNTTPGRGDNRNEQEESREREHAQPELSRYGNEGNVTNSAIGGLEGGQYSGGQCIQTESGAGLDAGTFDNGTNWDAADTDSRRQPGEEYGQEKPGRIAEKSLFGNWQDFPTQSPLCSRNDGVPGGLAGITFSKYRNESIKAYGNAIVPAVAYEIFKAIEQYDNKD